ncbi:uncharacterized protein FIBRA_04555 [Fibroporia radiculosa]|uniref:Uncharacterized protein n=1 Tax=Fibroporia radiculosa TaxID=599839 RepID=J4IA82_9APHY|nr:uncharacterized protein FIBRA_04555 [Fibroporia radiculosa]CCM02456.1 predicted protein [Fibroporia radiculosa]
MYAPVPSILAESSKASVRSRIPPIPLKDAKFTLDASGVAGFFGGDEAVSAMATVHVYQGRKWLGWYNSPGAYEISKRYGQLANSRFWDGLYPGPNTDPATLFELNGLKGPPFRSFLSGTVLPDSGHLGALLMAECEELKSVEIPGRQTNGPKQLISVVNLHHVPENEMNPSLLKKHTQLYASFPILVSVAACVLSGLFQDWWCFAMILLGILSSGWACWVIGSGRLTFIHPKPAPDCPPGNGILKGRTGIIVLKGEEGAVNSVTRGRFLLQFSSEPEYRNIGIASLFLTVQFVAQLLLIPQGTLFGQIMFVASLAVSWGYNSWLSSLDKESIQREILMKKILDEPEIRSYSITTRTTMAVLVCLFLLDFDPREASLETERISQVDTLASEIEKKRNLPAWQDGPETEKPQRISSKDAQKILEDLIPNDTEVWRRFRRGIADQIAEGRARFELPERDSQDLVENDGKLLRTLWGDAEAARVGYAEHATDQTQSAERLSV